MRERTHPEIPEGIFTEEQRTVEKQYHIFLHSTHPAEIQHREDAVQSEDWQGVLDDEELIPESVTLNTVSFYFEGTFKEAYIAAHEKCKTLNEENHLGDSEWEYERGSIMVAE